MYILGNLFLLIFDFFFRVHVNIEQDNISDSNIRIPKVRFNLAPQFNENFQSSGFSESGIGSSNGNGSFNNDIMTKTTVSSDFVKPPYQDIQHDDKVSLVWYASYL